MDGPIAVLAGTPVDTRMGVEYLTDRGLPGLAFPVSDGPREQTAFQHAPAEEKQRRAREILEAADPRAAGGPLCTATPCPARWTSRRWQRRRGCGS